MKKFLLNLPEYFTVHASALMNKVHHESYAARKDPQRKTISEAREQSFSVELADMKSLFPQPVRPDLPLK